MREKTAYFIAAIIYVAILYTLVRPGSKGTVLIGSIGSALSDLVRGVAGQTYDKTTGKWQ
jgi:uncharacterized membrane protein